MNSKWIPEDIAHTIVEHIVPRDRPTLKALATVARIFTYPCQGVLFQKLVIYFRRKNLERHVLIMHTFFTAHPSLLPYVRHLEIADNNLPSAHKRETSAPLLEISTEDLHSSAELCSSGIYALLFKEDSLLPQLLDSLVNLATISISIKNIHCSWLQFIPSLGKSLIRLFQNPDLRKLYIQGLRFIPTLALANFRDLRELYIKECDLDLFNREAYYNLMEIHVTRKFSNRNGRRRLELLTIQDIATSSLALLLNVWQDNTDRRFIDMSFPKELTIYISTFRSLSILENLLQICQEGLEALTIHTWGLRLGTSFHPPSASMLGSGIPHVHSPYDWFHHVMQPLQLNRPRSLLNLTLWVSFWRNTSFPEANGELEWALQTLRDLRPNHRFKEIAIKIRVGGEHKQDRLAFVDFQRYRGWRNWDIELNNSKWWDVETFLFLVCCDCGPKLIKGTEDIQSMIARQMPLLMESGKLAIGHVLLGEEGLSNFDIVKWIYES